MNRKTRFQAYSLVFQAVCLIANIIAISFLAVLLLEISQRGISHVNLNFLINYPSRFPQKAGILSAFVGSIFLMILTSLFSVVIGIGGAIFLEEYSKNTPLIRFIKLNIKNLSGVPSIIYGILGLTLFVRTFGMGRSLLAGSLTMALLILPVITMAAQEALRAVPESIRWAGFGIGMTHWQVIRFNVLPLAFPGMATGIILALSRAIGETAPLIMIGALSFVAFVPANPLDSFTALPIQIFNWTARPQKGFHDIAAAGIIVLLLMLLSMNAAAVYLRYQYKRKFKDMFL